ncbi:MAG: hypothetical protein NC204_01765 [Candidatus Amulumruptor caecigallinarius]|nr:hypothetical protein [Candidatus Amulumruptor caecigallinarius]
MEKMSFGMRLLLWLIGFILVGCLVCVVLAIVKVAVKVMVIVAGVCVILALLGIVCYNRIKEKQLENQLEKTKKQEER